MIDIRITPQIIIILLANAVTIMSFWLGVKGHQVELDTASFLRCSINTCKLTSSVNMGVLAPSYSAMQYTIMFIIIIIIMKIDPLTAPQP